MTVTHFGVTVAALASIFAVLAVIAGMLRWIYRRGETSQKQISAVEANTEATSRLTAAYEKSSERTENMLLDHEKRLVSLESTRVSNRKTSQTTKTTTPRVAGK
jgi:uncharacterized protein HemX